MDLAPYHERARRKGVNPVVYRVSRWLLLIFSLVYFRLRRIGRDHLPAEGGVIIAANHRSFLDPFILGLTARRPIYYVAKRELFRHRLVAWYLSALGAFPVRRGEGDAEMLETAKAILARGDALVLFPEGTRIRPGGLGRPRRGVGRLALETGAPVVPVAVIGTEDVRRGWRIRPRRIRVRVGRPLTFPRVENPSGALATAVTERIWPNVMLQWEWLGGLPPVRRAAVIGAGEWAGAIGELLARAGIDVEHGTGDLELSGADLVVFAVPATELPIAVAAHGGAIPSRAGVLVLSRGLVPPLGTLPVAYVAERVRARAVGVLGGPAEPADALREGAALVLAAHDRAFARQVREALRRARIEITHTRDVVGVELASAATDAAALAAAAAAEAGPNAAGAAAGKVFAEITDYARRAGAQPETLAGLAGTGDLVATVLGDGSGPTGAQTTVPLLAKRVHDAGVEAPVLGGLAGMLEGRVQPERWAATLISPNGRRAA
jgi:glycerol-3-phosphate dehydrogenase (NAD(P)+)